MPNNSNNSNYQNNKKDIEINIQFINQNDYKGLHRSGWQYVVDSLGQFQSNNSNNSMICDLYLDRTFHWNYDEYKKLGIIPYTKNWIGFIHHTTDEEYTSYNTINLFKNKLFLLSLQHCRGLFVLSNELKHKIENILYNANIKINIYSLIHPTESVSEANLFTIKKFLTNPSRKIIQIGAWMRVINAINKINLGKNTLLLEKYALRGKKMDNYYYIDDNTPRISHTSNVLDLTNTLNTSNVLDLTNLSDNSDNSDKSNKNSTDISDAYIDIDDDFTVSTNTVNNDDNDNQVFKNVELIINKINKNKEASISRDNKERHTKISNDVKILNYLENTDYDNLLSENIVFINLVGASAVNTVIECIVRNTPIIVNKLPALVEILGDKYPLFYDKLTDVTDLLNKKTIESGHNYLKNINKEKFTIDYFIKSFIMQCKIY